MTGMLQTQSVKNASTYKFEFNERELRLLEFATWRLMNQAHFMHRAMSEKGDASAASSFCADAVDAANLVAKLRKQMFTKNTTRVEDAQPPKES